jgi:crotonobetainyl-CoA:carnitine CoA-transferase CaiB-like acyl-CoA transferase
MTAPAPLDGVRVIAVEQYGAGPWATLQLAALGAEVIKVEDAAAGGDVGRYVVPYQEGEESLFFESFNRGKRSVMLDLRDGRGREVLHDLLRSSDVLLSNLRGDHVARLGLRYADLEVLNPRLVCCSITGFGRTGPRAAEGAYDYTIQGFAGWMSLTGEPGTPPTRTGLSLVDVSAGYVAALSISAMLVRRAATGLGGDADISLFETALAMDMYVATWVLSRGFVPERPRSSAHPSVVPFQTFRTRDGWIVVCCAKESLFRRFAEAIGRADLPADPRFATIAARASHRDACVEAIEAALSANGTSAWLERLVAAGVPCGPVNDVAAAFADPQAAARDMVEEYHHPALGLVRTPRPAVRADGAPTLGRAPRRGEHADAVLAEVCGYGPERIAGLRAAGVLG